MTTLNTGYEKKTLIVYLDNGLLMAIKNQQPLKYDGPKLTAWLFPFNLIHWKNNQMVFKWFIKLMTLKNVHE